MEAMRDKFYQNDEHVEIIRRDVSGNRQGERGLCQNHQKVTGQWEQAGWERTMNLNRQGKYRRRNFKVNSAEQIQHWQYKMIKHNKYYDGEIIMPRIIRKLILRMNDKVNIMSELLRMNGKVTMIIMIIIPTSLSLHSPFILARGLVKLDEKIEVLVQRMAEHANLRELVVNSEKLCTPKPLKALITEMVRNCKQYWELKLTQNVLSM
jgi:hypothetical protein